MSERTGTGDLSKIEYIKEAWMSAEEVADFIGVSAQSIREQARTNPVALGFPVTVIGTRVKVPRDGFFFWVQYGSPKV